MGISIGQQMKRPWMPLYVADYLSKTAHLTAAESGAYLHLLMYYWTYGGLPDDEKAIAQITRLTPRAWAKSRVHIKVFFLDHWKQPRMEQEIAKAIEISNKRSASAKLKHSKWGANGHTLHTSHTHIESIGGFKEAKKGFEALPHSPEFVAWKAFFTDAKKITMVRELDQRELENRAFSFEAQWPPH